ncbi:MAG: hypothetical protein PHQ50_01670 [Eubacteriales bacterium]|nr:hypothetical protein [Eubacteriales bacterium]MDD3349905.1 hypothetical protein [Eubacteriales bacterium]
MRLSNPKTKNETGFDFVLREISVVTPFGKKELRDCVPFGPGEEGALIRELGRVGKMLEAEQKYPEKTEIQRELFLEIKDNSFTIERSANNALSIVELFEVKTLLLQMKTIKELWETIPQQLPQEFVLSDTVELLDELDPGKERLNTFYLYDAFSERLALLRQEKREIEISIRKLQKELRRQVEAKHDICMTPKMEYLVAKADKKRMEEALAIRELVYGGEDYMAATFVLKNGEEVDSFREKIEEINATLEEEELLIREILSKKIAAFREVLLENCDKIGKIDFALAKAIHAKTHSCVCPTILSEHKIAITEGRQLVVEEILKKKGKAYLPISLDLQDGVTCITGANMGGKTVSLKLVGLCVLLAQHGFYVPCKSAEIGLSSFVHILIGDSQNLERGLSSFGSEMEELKDILDQSREKSLLLIDELASGTNPAEGLALTKSLVSYLKDKAYISLVTTHFDSVALAGASRNLQVRGLADADFRKLSGEINRANRRERIEIIGKYMDYRLFPVENEKEIPKDALNIAKMLGIPDQIIEQAKKYMEDRKDEK